MLGMRVRGTTDADAASGSRAALVATRSRALQAARLHNGAHEREYTPRYSQ